MGIPKSTEVEKLFFKEFGIKKYQALLRKMKVGGFTQEEIMVYPQIDSEVLMKIVCILNKSTNSSIEIKGYTFKQIEECILKKCIKEKEKIFMQITILFHNLNKETVFAVKSYKNVLIEID